MKNKLLAQGKMFWLSTTPVSKVDIKELMKLQSVLKRLCLRNTKELICQCSALLRRRVQKSSFTFQKVDSRTVIQNQSSMETLCLVNLSFSTKDSGYLMKQSLRSLIKPIKANISTTSGTGLVLVQTPSSVPKGNLITLNSITVTASFSR